MRNILLIFLLFSAEAFAQPATGWRRAPYRSEFISYSLREAAERGDRDGERYYYPIESMVLDEANGRKIYKTMVDIPLSWSDREIFLHTEGGRNSHAAYVNDTPAGTARDSRTPSEFNITRLLRTGLNIIAIEITPDTREPESRLTDERPDLETVFLYSQPFTRIEDFRLQASSGGVISVDIMTANSYAREEAFTVGYDVFGPDGRLQHYDMREVTLSGVGRDTLRLSAEIEGAHKNLWSAESPKLYNVMLFIRKKGVVIEYIPLKAGFGATGWDGDGITRNGKRIDIASVSYNAAGTTEQTAADIRGFKNRGINTLCPDYPQPWWFYDLCNREGIYVIDRVNINSAHKPLDRNIGGTPSNNPAWLDEYMQRTKATFTRSRNHPCIIGWSLGSYSGNGYNMYKTYLWLKAHDPVRPVIYNGAAGEWNSDFDNGQLKMENGK